MVAYNVIGKSVPRFEGVDKVTGAARYTADFALPGTLWGKVLHSPYAHARIVRIDTAAAEALPGVRAVITGVDVRGHLYGTTLCDIPVLAYDHVRFAGERVAAVAADDEDIAQQALDLIQVDYEELAAVFDPIEAMAPDAPQLHPEFNSYKGVLPPGVDGPAPTGYPMGLQPLAAPSNAYSRRTPRNRGSLEQGFAAADIIVENVYYTQRQHQGYLEPQTNLVHIDQEGRVHVWSGTKMPHATKANLAYAAGIDPARIIVSHAFIGGDFGGKATPFDLPACYFLAQKAGRPVRMVSNYAEELLAGNPRHATVVRLRSGVKRDGTLTAHEVEFIVNCGAYAGFKPFGAIFGPDQAAGPYRVANVRVQSAHVYTNTVPGGYMRGPGEAQAVFALESHIDELARAVGMDPVAFRLKNLVREGDETAFGTVFEDVKAVESLEAATKAADYDAPKRPNLGRGVALGERPPGGGEGSASVTLRPDGSAVLGTPIFDQGTGTYTVLRQVVAEELGLPLERVAVEVWDTDAIASDSGVAGSWATRVNTAVAHEAVAAARKELLRHAAEQLGWPEATLSMRGDEIWRSDIEERIGWRELLRRSGKSVSGQAHLLVGMGGHEPHITSFAAQVAEVEVDPETGAVRLLRLTSAHDIGQVINPLGHQGQINGGIVTGVGYALMEELRVEDGRVTSLSLGDYKLPTMRDIPELRTVLVESDSGVGPYKLKAIGELPVSPVAAAIANAVADATGVRIRSLPITAEKVYEALKERP